MVAFDDACHVRHATETELDVEYVTNFMVPVVRGKILVIS